MACVECLLKLFNNLFIGHCYVERCTVGQMRKALCYQLLLNVSRMPITLPSTLATAGQVAVMVFHENSHLQIVKRRQQPFCINEQYKQAVNRNKRFVYMC